MTHLQVKKYVYIENVVGGGVGWTLHVWCSFIVMMVTNYLCDLCMLMFKEGEKGGGIRLSVVVAFHLLEVVEYPFY